MPETVVDEYDAKHGKYQEQAPGISTGAKPRELAAPYTAIHNPNMTNGGENGGKNADNPHHKDDY